MHNIIKTPFWAAGLVLILSISFAQITLAEENNEKESRLPIQDVQRFTTAISQIKNYYVDEVQDKELFEDAIRGMLEGLDPHSAYLDDQDFKDLKASTKGEFSGLGIEVTMESGYIKVISPIDDTPAYRAGVQAGDMIVRIDTKAVKGLSLREAVNLMRGKRGSQIKLVVLRKGEQKPLKFTITRDIIQVKSVKGRLIDNHYAYVRISHFQSPTASDMNKLLKKLGKEAKGDLKGLILDLRNNPGGLLDSAIQVSDAFIHNDKKGDEEKIVYTKGRLPGSEFTANATPGDILKKSPIVVLINEGSASGSEIVAGALQDNNRAILMGTKTFGKGSVQTVLPLDGDRGIKLTTALYYTPAGRSIQAKGIVPDIEIKHIKLPETKVEEDNLAFITEADLANHLANGNGKEEKKTDKKDDKKTDKDDKNLAYTDYQLYQALTLLKGLAIVQN